MPPGVAQSLKKGEKLFNLVNPVENTQLEQAYEIADLFKKLDHFTRQGRPVVITDESGEVKAGNMLAWEYAGKQLKEGCANGNN